MLFGDLDVADVSGLIAAAVTVGMFMSVIGRIVQSS